jgi:hypothetical protein
MNDLHLTLPIIIGAYIGMLLWDITKFLFKKWMNRRR